jgi:hypothetical protein
MSLGGAETAEAAPVEELPMPKSEGEKSDITHQRSRAHFQKG